MTNGIMPKLEYLNPPKYDQYPKYREYLREVTDFFMRLLHDIRK